MKITSIENGPNKVEFDGATGWQVLHSSGAEEVLERKTIFLCRCGHSENKPFCDGTHNKIGFEASGTEVEVVAG